MQSTRSWQNFASASRRLAVATIALGAMWGVQQMAAAQETPAAPSAGKDSKASARPQDLEPAVDTSAPAAKKPAPKPSASSSAMEPAVNTSAPPPSVMESAVDTSTPPPQSVLNPSVDTSAAAAEEAPAQAAAGAQKGRTSSRSGKAMDRLELDTTQITGNRELPKVLAIVPWKRSDLGDLLGKPVNSLLDEVLTPVDRDVFKRENRYFTALDASGSEAAAPPAK